MSEEAMPLIVWVGCRCPKKGDGFKGHWYVEASELFDIGGVPVLVTLHGCHLRSAWDGRLRSLVNGWNDRFPKRPILGLDEAWEFAGEHRILTGYRREPVRPLVYASAVYRSGRHSYFDQEALRRLLNAKVPVTRCAHCGRRYDAFRQQQWWKVGGVDDTYCSRDCWDLSVLIPFKQKEEEKRWLTEARRRLRKVRQFLKHPGNLDPRHGV